MQETNKHPRVAIVILNWNGWQDTIECLDSVFQLDYPEFNVVLVDNGSDDESVDEVLKYCDMKAHMVSRFHVSSNPYEPAFVVKPSLNHSNIEIITPSEDKGYISRRNVLFIIETSRNVGFTGGNNVGMSFCMKALHPDFILLLNNDTVVDRRLLVNMLSSICAHRKNGLCQAKLVYYQKPHLINTTGNQIDIFGATSARGFREIDRAQYNDLRKEGFFYPSGACVLISSELIARFDDIPFFDESLFACHEDVDMGWMARLLEFDIVFSPEAICYHKESKSIRRHPSLAIQYLGQRNSIRVLIKNYSTGVILFVLPFSVLINGIVSVLIVATHHDTGYIKAFAGALVWNMKNIGDTISKRRWIQSRRRVSDREVIRYMSSGSFLISTIVNKASEKLTLK